MPTVDPKGICQIAIVVRDIEKTARNIADAFGMNTPRIYSLPPVEDAHTRYRGSLTTTRSKLAVFQMGPIMFELIQPDNEPSSWKEFLERSGEGVHHIGFMVDDLQGTLDFLAKKGMPERHSGDYPGGRYVFVESEEQLGVILSIKHEEHDAGGKK